MTASIPKTIEEVLLIYMAALGIFVAVVGVLDLAIKRWRRRRR